MTTRIFSAGAADCWANASGTFNNNGAFLYLAGDAGIDGDPRAWIPFVVDLPKGLVITSALIRWYATTTREDDTAKVKISCEAADNPSAPVSNAGVYGRVRTSALHNFNLEHYTAGVQYSYNITGAVQEVLNRSGWASGNTLAVMVDDNGTINDIRRQIATVENTSYPEAILEIAFQTFFPRNAGLI